MELPLNQVIWGNCIEVLNDLPEQSVDLIFADPPYNLQLQQDLMRPNQTMVNPVDDPWDQFESFADYDRFTRQWLAACRRVLKENGTIWVIGSYHNIFRVGRVMMDLGYWFMNDVIWHKTNPMPNFKGARFTNATETLIWSQKSAEQKRYTFNYHALKHLNDDKQMTNVWNIPICRGGERIRIDGRKVHSTQKPEALLYRVISASSNPGDVVLDPFFGTGTTGAVAKKLKRHFIGIERELDYVRVAQARIDAIADLPLDEELLHTPTRRGLPRVKFGKLLEMNYLAPGQVLYSPKRRHMAVIKTDSHLICGEMTGSIHRVASLIKGGPTGTNGWDFWHYEDENGLLLSINTLREQYRQEHGLI